MPSPSLHQLLSSALCLALTICTFQGTAYGAHLVSAKSPKGKLLERAQLALEVNRRAEGELYDQMKSVGSWLEDFRDQYGRFPSLDAESEAAFDELYQRLPADPYAINPSDGNPVTSAAAHNENTVSAAAGRQRVRIILDTGLNDDQVRQLEIQAPPLWRAQPGTITVINNGEDRYLIWGAGADRQSIRDEALGRNRLVIGPERPETGCRSE